MINLNNYLFAQLESNTATYLMSVAIKSTAIRLNRFIGSNVSIMVQIIIRKVNITLAKSLRYKFYTFQ